VSGLSSVGFMAVQFHVAFSGTIVGAGITAGGVCLPALSALTLQFHCPHLSRRSLLLRPGHPAHSTDGLYEAANSNKCPNSRYFHLRLCQGWLH